MMKLNVGGKEYKIKFGFNCFCDTDLMDRVKLLATLFSENDTQDDNGAASIGKLKDLFSIVRDLIYTGAQRYNPFDSPQDVGDLLDVYMDEAEEGKVDEERGLMHLFNALSEELFNEGFLADVMSQSQETGMENGAKAPTDHKSKQ